MKTAISLPDDVFERAEAYARRAGLSRSELYATAVAEYVERYGKAGLTEAYDRAYADEGDRLDPALADLQRHAIERAAPWTSRARPKPGRRVRRARRGR